MDKYHFPVMLQESLDYLNIKEDGTYVDCTLGGGGHSSEIAKMLSKNGRLISLDMDEDAINYVQKLQGGIDYECTWDLVQSNFSKLHEIVKKLDIDKVDGILFDLGVSSHQLDTETRGFSYKADALLDMRMDRSLKVTAKDLVNGLYVKELGKLLGTLGEEPRAKRIAKAIVEEREENKIETTGELFRVIQKVVPFKAQRKTAMRVFQALRIAVNSELLNLQLTLPQALEILASDGRLVVISFHSLEDRIVKNFMRDAEENGVGKRIIKSPVLPSEHEVKSNKRSRSAKMRIFEKL